MHEYSFCGDRVRSATVLPELLSGDLSSPSSRTWTCSPASLPECAAASTVHTWRDGDDAEWLRIDRHEHGYRITFAIGADFDVTGQTIRWSGAGRLPEETVRHLLIDQVLPLAMSAPGTRLLHAAAVRIGGGAVAFAGASGQGKSTLASAFASRGHAVLSDDCVRLGSAADLSVPMPLAYPSYPGVRLWPDSIPTATASAPTSPVAHYTRKARVATDFPGPHAIPLRRIYLLQWTAAADPSIAAAGARGVVDLIRFAFRLDPTRHDLAADDFAVYAGLVEQGIVRRLAVPRSLDALDRVVALVTADAA